MSDFKALRADVERRRVVLGNPFTDKMLALIDVAEEADRHDVRCRQALSRLKKTL